VARQGHVVTLTETVHELKLPKTTVFRYLQTLSAAGFLEHDMQHDRYCDGVKFRSLARVDQELQVLLDIAQPEMRTLMETFHETVNLAVLSENEVVYIDMLEPGRPLRASARIGHRHPAHSTSLGKAMMAFLPDADALALGCVLPQRTINTLTDADKLRRQVDDVRRRGYAIEVGENEDGLMCIGVPILNRTGYPVAAMSLSAPERRMKPELTIVAADALKVAAKRISTHLSSQPHS
jgi:DNA-binding IclR family transcriptional regulator